MQELKKGDRVYHKREPDRGGVVWLVGEEIIEVKWDKTDGRPDFSYEHKSRLKHAKTS